MSQDSHSNGLIDRFLEYVDDIGIVPTNSSADDTAYQAKSPEPSYFVYDTDITDQIGIRNTYSIKSHESRDSIEAQVDRYTTVSGMLPVLAPSTEELSRYKPTGVDRYTPASGMLPVLTPSTEEFSCQKPIVTTPPLKLKAKVKRSNSVQYICKSIFSVN